MSSHQPYQTQAIYLRHWKAHNALHIAEELFVSRPLAILRRICRDKRIRRPARAGFEISDNLKEFRGSTLGCVFETTPHQTTAVGSAIQCSRYGRCHCLCVTDWREHSIATVLQCLARSVRTIRCNDRSAAGECLYDCVAEAFINGGVDDYARPHHPGERVGDIAGEDAFGPQGRNVAQKPRAQRVLDHPRQ